MYSQCAVPTVGCPNTNLANYGANSNTDATTLEYDNFVSSFHSTVARTGDGTFQLWGEKMANNGSTHLYSPVVFNATNYPALGAANPLKIAVASDFVSTVQGILLATDGLYAWATEGTILDASLTSSSTFQKLTINGNSNGLPTGVAPSDVKMMFVTNQTIALTTCSGNVWILSQDPNMRGNGATGSNTVWSRVTTTATGNPFLTNVVATRGSAGALMALCSDGTVYTWGSNVYLGNNTAIIATQNRARQMTLPAGITPKMIGSGTNSSNQRSYYVLATDGNLYAMGNNTVRQLGDFTTSERRSWVQPRYASGGAVMNNIIWMSPQEHDTQYNGINVINSTKNIYAFGENNNTMLGATNDPTNPVIPGGLTGSDIMLAVETGGHTSMTIKQCESNYGYVGHRINGSIGNGVTTSGTESVFTFSTSPIVLCGASTPEIALSVLPTGPTSKYCIGSNVDLIPSPSGGTLSVLSGPGVLVGNNITFTGVGTVVVQYVLPNPCGGPNLSTSINLITEYCDTDVSVTKTVNNSAPIIGSNVTFTITATNNSSLYNAYNVVVNDPLPSGYTLVGSPTLSVGTFSSSNWNIGVLAPSATATMTITATVLNTGSYANTASISSNAPDPTTSNNSATSTPVPVSPPCVLTTPAGSVTVQPTCAVTTGTIVFTTQSGVEYSIDGTTYQSSATFTGVAPGTYTLRVRSTTDNTC
ncbi:hypothetical protein, partial [uncultured Flavobacterium sp.]|uniref:hypothetical protein n=1 Tax=uncultured Flavobacterium sp. TaxID=165435 RepID=UPI00263209B5